MDAPDITPFVKTMIGDLVIQIATLQAQLAAAHAQQVPRVPPAPVAEQKEAAHGTT